MMAGASGKPVPVVAVRHLTKSFPGVRANDDVSLDFHAGEIHVLLGENGAGKSTLIALLAGMQQPDAGTIEIDGKPVRIASPRRSLDLGIGTVFQHMLLVESLSVIANLTLGGPWWQRLGGDAPHARFRELSKLLGVSLDPDAIVGDLSLGEQQQVEIMRALWRDERVLILDEPTSMLTPQGVADLAKVMQRLRDQGVALIFITHKLNEAYALGDRVSILRQGRVVGAISPAERQAMSEAAVTERIIALMFGTTRPDAEAELFIGRAEGHKGRAIDRKSAPILQVENITTAAAPAAVKGVGLELWRGEILGIAGIDGNGQKALAEALAGQRPIAGGRLLFDGRDITHQAVPERRAAGICYVTDDRLGEGTVGSLSVAANLLLKEIGTAPFWRRGITDWDLVHAHARDLIARNDIRTPHERAPIGKLSGGNIQKALLARELGQDAAVVIFNKPTYGLDLQNSRLARERILESAQRGIGTIVISTDLDEILALSDRIAVMRQGRIVAILENGPGVDSTIGRLMTGSAAA